MFRFRAQPIRRIIYYDDAGFHAAISLISLIHDDCHATTPLLRFFLRYYCRFSHFAIDTSLLIICFAAPCRDCFCRQLPPLPVALGGCCLRLFAVIVFSPGDAAHAPDGFRLMFAFAHTPACYTLFHRYCLCLRVTRCPCRHAPFMMPR